MEILIIGSTSQQEEVRTKFGDLHHYAAFGDHAKAEQSLRASQVIFDFLAAENPEHLIIYKSYPSLIVFIDTTFTRLSNFDLTEHKSFVFGFCGMPTFLNRDILEASVISNDHKKALDKIGKELKTAIRIVADQVGLVTPRVICMIINEAFYTVEEGTATREDIDKAMKLGTNYPFGPFEWCEKIGSNNVCRLLEAMLKETNDGRYTTCKMLTLSTSI